ncbi:hypothetical protein [Synechococcus sp. PCC 7336]|uniref:hypothetical protein n=1 Tax=Synechococcus sp. PCC 7336 TaxID=195250 RepID=UPI0003474C63|nr:hypothetical protein [Synechococcus sp. PCC 7336]
MRFFKALFGGIANFFKILFGGLLGAFTGPQAEAADPASATATLATAAEPAFRGDGASAGSTPAATVAATVESTPVDPNAPIETETEAEPAAPVQFASLNELPLTRPKRRPGAALAGFKSMARELMAEA